MLSSGGFMKLLFQPLVGKKREEGAMAILMVVGVSLAVVTTLSTVYIYLVNRTKYHSRIKEAYQMTHVMEEVGKLTRQSRDSWLANNSSYDPVADVDGTCSNGVTP